MINRNEKRYTVVRPRLLVLFAALLVGTAGSASADAEGGGAASFTASTAGAPVGLAVGGWSSETSGRSGDLEVDFASGPEAASTAFEALWSSDLVLLGESEEQQQLGSAVYVDAIHNPVTETTTSVKIETRHRIADGTWSAWAGESTRTVNSRTRHEFAAVVQEVRRVAECTCFYQFQVRVSGAKSGLDASKLIVTVRAEG